MKLTSYVGWDNIVNRWLCKFIQWSRPPRLEHGWTWKISGHCTGKGIRIRRWDGITLIH